MSADASSQPTASGTARAGRELHPGYFAFVMATGIVSTAAFLLGPSWLARVFFVLARPIGNEQARLAASGADSRPSLMGGAPLFRLGPPAGKSLLPRFPQQPEHYPRRG